MSSGNNGHLIVVGGGITGLAIAYIAAREGKQVTVLEGSPKFGGLLDTFSINGNRLERFYHHFFTHDAEINWLINDLGLKDKLIYRKTKMGVYHQGKVYDFTTTKDLIGFSPLGWMDKLRFGLSGIYLGKMADWRNNEHVSALEWFQKKVGGKVAKVIWEPLLKVKFGQYYDKIPLAWMIGRLRQRMGSRKNGDEKLGYIKGSLGVLLDALLLRLKSMGVELVANAKVEELVIHNGEIKGVNTEASEFHSDKVVLTIPSTPVEKLLRHHNASLADKVSRVKYFGAVCVILELKQALSDIYWLNVAEDNFPFGGIIEQTNFIGPEGYDGMHIAYLSRYFTQDETIANMDDGEIKQMMIGRLSEIYPEFKQDWIKKTHIFKTRSAATVCDLNFSEKVIDAKLPIKGLFLANMMHIYPDERSVNNSIRVAAEVCRVMGVDSGFVPKGSSLSGQIGF